MEGTASEEYKLKPTSYISWSPLVSRVGKLLCKQSGEPLDQPPGQGGCSTIGRLLQEKTGQALGSTTFNIQPRMPSGKCHNNDLIGSILRPPRPISFSFENLNMVLWLKGPESCNVKVKVNVKVIPFALAPPGLPSSVWLWPPRWPSG